MSLATGRPKAERLFAMRVLLWATSKQPLATAVEISQQFGMSLMSARLYRIDIVNAIGMQRELDRVAAADARDTARGAM
jgi:hypothetical protein